MTGNNLDNYDKEKLILMLQVRQLILVTSHPSTLLFILFFLENVFGLYFCPFFLVNKEIPMQLPIKGVRPVQG